MLMTFLANFVPGLTDFQSQFIFIFFENFITFSEILKNLNIFEFLRKKILTFAVFIAISHVLHKGLSL